MKHAVEIEQSTFRKLIPIETPALKVESGDGWHLSLYRGDCGALCAIQVSAFCEPQYYIIDINA